MRYLILKSIPAGARWITVHPPGHEKGSPVLIQEHKDGTASVIGGAGGSLNHLRLRAVKSVEDYKKDAREKAAIKRKADAEQRKRDKEAGIYQSKVEAKRKVKEQELDQERQFIAKAAEILGWKPEEHELDEGRLAEVPPEEQPKVAAAHQAEVLKRINAAIESNREALITDSDRRAQIETGQVPLSSADPEQLSVDDLDPVQATNAASLGFSAKFGERAAAAGADEAAIKQEAAELRQARDPDAKPRVAKQVSETVQKKLAEIRQPEKLAEAKQAIVEADKAVELLKLRKQLRTFKQKAAKVRKEIDQAKEEPKALLVDAGAEVSDADVLREIEGDMRTRATRAFLETAAKVGDGDPHKTLARHVNVGAFNAVNALSMAVAGDSMMDRSVVDVLGISGAAQVMANRLRQDLSADEFREFAEGLKDFHVNRYMKAGEETVRQANDLLDGAEAIKIPDAADGHDLAAAQEINAKRRQAVDEARRVIGQAVGELETNAALVFELQGGVRDKSTPISMGKLSTETAIRQLRAIGLQRGEYELDTVNGSQVVTLTRAGLDRLAKPANRADFQQLQRNLDIIGGSLDEENWLPLGVANRPDLETKAKPGQAPRLAMPFEPTDDLEQSLRDYIGARKADGEPEADILADIQSADFFQKVGPDRAGEYLRALDSVASLRGEGGKRLRPEDLAGTFDRYADDFVRTAYGEKRSTLNKQTFQVDDVAVDALHRALSAEPSGVAAYKAIGDLTHDDRRALRDHFYREVAHESPEEASLRQQLTEKDAAEPERDVVDMFGEMSVNPDWQAWHQERNELAAKVNSASLSWSKYVDAMGGLPKAYEAVQDLIRSRVNKSFADAYNTLNPASPLKVGVTTIRNNLNHLDTVDPAARAARQAKERELIESLRNRGEGGQYAAGSVADKLDFAREQQAAAEAAQMGFFSTEELPQQAERAMGKDERYTLGHAAERGIAGLVGSVGANFKPGQPLKLFNLTMSGGKNFARQRAIKLLQANKRLGLHFGTGTGKTAIGLGGFSHLKEQGLVKRGLFLVPSVVQGQFGAEALRFLQPGKYSWHAEPGASREERLAAYKDPKHDFAVMTHQSFRDDMLHLGAQQAGVEVNEMVNRVNAMTPADRKAWMKGVMEKHGMTFDYLMVDEAHNALNRAGKANSSMANVVDALSANTPYYVSATGDPVKNDLTELHSALQKMDPERYADRDAFMRRYGVDTDSSKRELQREMARYFYPESIEPNVKADRTILDVKLSDAQKSAMADLGRNVAKARMARMRGEVDVDAIKAISPSTFASAPPEQHEAMARELQRSLGILKESAQRRIIDAHPESAKLDTLASTVAARKGKPGVVFAHSIEAVNQIKERLEREGHRVATITGKDSTADKDTKRRMFNPDIGEAQADILVASDAASTGLNLQRGQWLAQYDTPMTAKDHAQRNGRIFRTGQKNDVELIDLVADHPSERAARNRLANKYKLRELTTTPLAGLEDDTDSLGYFLKQRRVAAQEGQGGLF